MSEANPAYRPTDQLHLWWLAQPSAPIYIGQLNTARTQRGVSLRYDASWLARGFALSEDLPLIDQEFLPREKDTAAGAVDDARPDRWGERVIRFVDKPSRLSLLEYLYFAGDDRFGALGVSTSPETYSARQFGPTPSLENVAAIDELVKKVLANEPIPEAQKRLIAPGVTMGGARPKALIAIDGHQWVVKFSDGDSTDTPLVEHASMTLATRARIRVAPTRALRLHDGHAVAVKRFDRVGTQRLHAITANVALKAAGEQLGYPELAQFLRRRGIPANGTNVAHMRELFRRMVFNILIDNTDDHEKNHALLMDDAQQFALSPAYDVLPSGQALGYQQMRVGANEADSTLENAMSMCASFMLSKAEAHEEIATVAKVVANWKGHFVTSGVSERDIDLLAQQIDRSFLTDQRAAYAS